VTEAPDQTRVGRFGWKNSVATLLSFSAGAYLFEMGITSPLQPREQTSLGRSVAFADTVADPEDTGGEEGHGEDVEAFTRFMRSTKAPPRNIGMQLNDATDVLKSSSFPQTQRVRPTLQNNPPFRGQRRRVRREPPASSLSNLGR